MLGRLENLAYRQALAKALVALMRVKKVYTFLSAKRKADADGKVKQFFDLHELVFIIKPMSSHKQVCFENEYEKN